MATKRRLKDPDAPVVKRPPAEIALQAKILELDDYRAAHRAAVAAQIAEESNRHKSADPTARVEKRKLEFKIARAETETELLAVQAKAQRAKTVEAKSDWESAQRDRARLVIALRAANREIAALREQGITGPCDLLMMPGGFACFEDVLLGSQSRVGVNGKLARAYLVEAFNAGLLTRAELAEDD
jgi:hypothetical protein